MGQEGQHGRELSEQANGTARPLSSIFKVHGVCANSQTMGKMQTLQVPFKNAQMMHRGVEGCAPDCVHLDPISGCLKEKATGFTQGSLSLAIPFAVCDERTLLLDPGRAVVVFSPGSQ